MYYEERKSLAKNLLVIGLIGLAIFLAIFNLGDTFIQLQEEKDYSRFCEFLSSVNSGLYDNHRTGYPPEVKIWSYEQCLDDSRYLSGKIGGYSFQGYTTSSNPTSQMSWEFTGYQEFCPSAMVKTFGFAGIVVSSLLLLVVVGMGLLHVVRWFFA